jgi:hypothetical protein
MISKTKPVTFSSSYPSYTTSGYKSACYADDAIEASVAALVLKAATLKPLNLGTVQEAISYDCDKSRFNFCSHYHTSYEELLTGARYSIYKPTTVMGCLQNAGYIALTVKGWGNAPSLPAMPVTYLVTDELKREAWAAIQPELNSGFSLLNFLLELRDVKEIWALGNKCNSWLGLLGRAKPDPTKSLAEIHLLYQFGLKPLVSDIIEMFDLIKGVDKKINKFIEDGKKVRPYHFRKVVSEDETEVLPSSAYDALYEGCRTEYFCTISLSYEYKRPPMFEGLLRVWGLRPTVEHIWNAIPYTFIIDWIFKVNNFLRQLDKDPGLSIAIHDYCDTTKVTNWRESRNHVPATYAIGYLRRYIERENAPIWRVSRVAYLRQPGLPNIGYAFPVRDTLSLRELMLAGSLLRVHL